MRSWSSVPQTSGNVSGPPLPPPRHDPPARAPTDPQPPRRPAPTCPLPGLARETGEVEELQGELAKIQAEQDALPTLVKEVQDALEAEAAAFQRQEAGGHPGLPWDRSGAAPAEACAGLIVCVMHGARLCTGFASCQRGCRRLLPVCCSPHDPWCPVIMHAHPGMHTRLVLVHSACFVPRLRCSAVQPGVPQGAQAGRAAPGAGHVPLPPRPQVCARCVPAAGRLRCCLCQF